MVACGLASKIGSILQLGDVVTERIVVAQLYGAPAGLYLTSHCDIELYLHTGMSDALSNHVASQTRSNSPFVIKFVSSLPT
jgi:hypothetical protein